MKNLEIERIGAFSNQAHNIKDKDHLVHFYHNKNTLVDAVSNFIVPALTSNCGVILIATKENILEFSEAMDKRSVDLVKCKMLDQLVILDANETLNQFMYNGVPDRHKFFKTISAVLNKMRTKYPTIRAYGEMVNLLWHQDLKESAISL
jgi:hypothetical protein